MLEDNERYGRLRQEVPKERLGGVDYIHQPLSRERADGFFCRFTFGQFFALLILEVFTIFFVFYLGARYGPKLLGFEKDSSIIVGEQKTKLEPKVLTTSNPEVAAMADEIVQKAKTPELKERLAAMLKRSDEKIGSEGADVQRVPTAQTAENYTVESTNAQNKTQKELSSIETSAADKKSDGFEETARQMPMRQASEATEIENSAVKIKSSESLKYAIQVGSYQQLSEANAVVMKLKAKGYPAYLMIADIPDRGRWYRVRVGAFASRQEAQKYKQQFDLQEATDTLVVMNEQ